MRNVVDRYFDRLKLLNGLFYQFSVQSQAFRDGILERIENGEFSENQFGAGAALIVRDLTEWPSHGWAVHYSAGSFGTRGRDFARLADRFIAREAAWTISQAFEAFETCALDLLAAALLQAPELADGTRLARQRGGLARAGLSENELAYWQAFVRREYRKVAQALETVRAMGASLNDAETRNNRNTDLREWFMAVSEVRHATTHSDFIVKQKRLDAMAPESRDRLLNDFSGTSAQEGYALSISEEQAQRAVTTFTEYGYAVYKALRVALGLDWRVFLNQGTQ